VIRQELAVEKGIIVSLRTVERAVQAYRQELEAEARATVRFETPLGKQLQIDFGERLVEIAGSKVRTYLFVATLGYSRRQHIRAFRNERQESWFDGLESAFAKFGGVTEEVLTDNPRALVVEHDPTTRTLVFNEKFKAFAKHWGFRPRACAPYRARNKGKTENGVGYVKRNAIAGRSFPAGKPSRRTLRPGRGMLPMCACMARPARRRSSDSNVPRQSPQADCWDSAIPCDARVDPARAERLCGGDRWQCLFGAVAADRRDGACHDHGRCSAHPPRDP